MNDDYIFQETLSNDYDVQFNYHVMPENEPNNNNQLDEKHILNKIMQIQQSEVILQENMHIYKINIDQNQEYEIEKVNWKETN